MSRPKSLEGPYARWILKEYEYWTLLLHDEQRYLGRAYVWLSREGGMQRFSEITDEEIAELRVVLREYEAALADLFAPDFMNYSWLANLIAQHGGHGHMHLIPRYKGPRTFESVEFVDDKWGANCTPSTPFPIEDAVLETLRDTLKAELA